jgi:sortase A
VRRALAAVLVAVAAWHGARALWIEAKAELAQLLLRRAWQRIQAGNAEARPWPWADTRPVARLAAPALGVSTFVLSGASGRTLAFGPGHLDGTPEPGSRGNVVISGHRDTHFAFLERLRAGDELVLEGRDGGARRYRVAWARVVDRSELGITDDAGDTRLTLVTCYPFHALQPGGPLRYVVVALAADLLDHEAAIRLREPNRLREAADDRGVERVAPIEAHDARLLLAIDRRHRDRDLLGLRAVEGLAQASLLLTRQVRLHAAEQTEVLGLDRSLVRREEALHRLFLRPRGIGSGRSRQERQEQPGPPRRLTDSAITHGTSHTTSLPPNTNRASDVPEGKCYKGGG